jgi:hypothetical protein
MVEKRKKFLITSESHEIFIVRRNSNNTIQGFCSECQKEVEMLTLDSITSNTGRRTRELVQLIENNLIHSTETATGHLLICLDSLQQIEKAKLSRQKSEEE